MYADQYYNFVGNRSTTAAAATVRWRGGVEMKHACQWGRMGVPVAILV